MEVRAPAGTDLAVIAQALQSLGCDFNPEDDQLGQGPDTGAYALRGQGQFMKDAMAAACILENRPRLESRPAWSELSPEQRQRILEWFGEYPPWAD